MTDPSLAQEFMSLLDRRGRVVCSILADTFFTFAWLAIQWVFQRLTVGITLHGAERWAIPLAQGVLALSTLAAVLFYIGGDLITMFLRGRYLIEDLQRARARQLRQQDRDSAEVPPSSLSSDQQATPTHTHTQGPVP